MSVQFRGLGQQRIGCGIGTDVEIRAEHQVKAAADFGIVIDEHDNRLPGHRVHPTSPIGATVDHDCQGERALIALGRPYTRPAGAKQQDCGDDLCIYT